jgi:DNA invertase Pin-like site-specific DNA recombinase
MRAALYIRVSMENVGTEEKADPREQNPDLQLQPLRDYLQTHQMQEIGVFIDRMSGSEKTRPEFRRMLLKAKAQEFDIILVWKIDRFARFEPIESLLTLYKLNRMGVHVRSITEPYIDTTDSNPIPHEWRLVVMSMILSGAYAERKKISERTQAGIHVKKKSGAWKGGRPKGSKDSKPRARRWDKKPDVSVDDMFE